MGEQPFTKKSRVAVVGCGAVVEKLHLPALRRNPACEVVALVDRNETRAHGLATELGVERVLGDYRDLLDLDIDGAIVAVPTSLHAAMSTALLGGGIHVLVEKPMALSLEECDAMIAAEAAGRATLAVAHPRRVAHQCRLAKRVIAQGILGTIKAFDVRDGYGFGWPVTTDYVFRKETAGGGVLLDLGIHTLDLLVWLFGDLRIVEHRDNDQGGVESESLTYLGAESGIEGVVEFSRTRLLRNTLRVWGDRGRMEVSLTSNKVRLERLDGTEVPMDRIDTGDVERSADQAPVDLTLALQLDWQEAVRSGRPPALTGEEAMRSLSLVFECYAGRLPLEVPWIAAVREGVSP